MKKVKKYSNVWGAGQLFTFSGIDGVLDYENDLILRSTTTKGVWEFKAPQSGGVLLNLCRMASFCVENQQVRSVDVKKLKEKLLTANYSYL